MKFTNYYTRNRRAYIVLARPEKRNALNFEMVTELKTHFENAENNPDVKVVILRGEGKAFCAGADLDALKQMQQFTYEENLEDSKHLAGLYRKIYTLRKPVVAMLTGHAIAGGAGLATVCDFIFAIPEAKYGYTEINIGFVPAIVSVFLLRKIGEAKAKALLLTGQLFSAQEALDAGIFNGLFPIDAIESETEKFVEKLIVSASAKSLELTKSLINQVQTLNLEDALEYASRLNADARAGSDCKKGVSAFLNKEKPSW